MIYDSETSQVQQFGIDAAQRPVYRAPAGFWESFGHEVSHFYRENLSVSRQLGGWPFREERARRIQQVAGDEAFVRALTTSADPQTYEMITDLARKYPGFILTDEEILGELKERNRQLRAEKEIALQDQTTAGKIGGFAGIAVGALSDPLNLALMPLGASASAGILRAMVTEAGIAMATEAMIQPVVYRWKKELESPYSVGEAALNIAGAGVGAAAFTGVVRGTAHLLAKSLTPAARRVHGYDDLLEAAEAVEHTMGGMPTTARDAEWVLGDTAEILRQSPFEKAAPELDELHMAAVRKAHADIEAGRPVDVGSIIEQPQAPRRVSPTFADMDFDDELPAAGLRKQAEDILSRQDMQVRVGGDDVVSGEGMSVSARQFFQETDEGVKAARVLRACLLG